MSKALRINFELDRADNPPLYDELAKFAKGAKRVNRLRTLAHAGLLSQIVRTEAAPIAPTAPPRQDDESMHTAASMELFGPSL
ncbi:MAG: hypothetical protein K2X55_13200 [Burkholderiaceae bacterium]|nr:hypothetical protein [Burkholderiaceae bacterium]